jgi:hypothetical protein
MRLIESRFGNREQKMNKRIYLTIWLVIVLLFTSCNASATSIPATVAQTPLPTMVAPTNTFTAAPVEISSLPGFEDWSTFNPQAVDISLENGSLVLTLKQRALWFMEQHGVLVYKLVKGDFKITAEVHTAKTSDPTQPPGGDNTVQLGGLMARNGNPGRENYVFIVAGDDGNGLSIETKNTTNSMSEYSGPAWDSASAELRLCRFGPTFNLYKRRVSASEAWTLAAAFERPDLPEDLQAGLNIYTDSTPDLQIRYDHVKIEPITSLTECESD